MSQGHTAAIVATIMAAIITAGVSLYIHFDSPEVDILGTVAEQAEPESTQETTAKSPTLNIADVFITPIDTKIPTSFFAEISNTGTDSAKGIQLAVDFGESTIQECELQPESIAKPVESKALSIQTYNIAELRKDSSVYVSCAINLPYFKKIQVGGGNVNFEKSLTYDAYKNSMNGESVGFYGGIWRAIVIFFLFMGAFKIIGFLFD